MKTKSIIQFSLALALLLGASSGFTQDPPEPVLPQVQITSPIAVINQQEAAQLPSSPGFTVRGVYEDATEDIWYYRTILKRALLPGGNYATTSYSFTQNRDQLLPFDDPEWTEWQTWDLGSNEIEVSYADLPQYEPDPENPGQDRLIFYIFATQIMASDGTVSTGRRYGYQVANFRITTALRPVLVVEHPLLGRYEGAGENLQTAIDFLPGIEGEFTWEGRASDYGGEIASYRWGWDILDVDDPDDPNWALPPGLSDAHRRAGPIPFVSGVHTLTIKVVDSFEQVTIRTFVLSVVPIPDPSSQHPLLLVDDVRDQSSNAWPDAHGMPRDRDEYRDEFWLQVLAGGGGVAGFNPQDHVVDTEMGQVELRDVVQYRAVVWNSRWVSAPNSAISREFRPVFDGYGPEQPRYNWLGAYQELAGNLLLCGSRVANAFLAEAPYVLPVVFESDEGSFPAGMEYINGQNLRVGFGSDLNGDPTYPVLYDYRNLGLAALDITSPNAAYYTHYGYLMNNERRKPCVGLKGLALDQDFVQNHMGGVPAFSETIWTEPVIDWQDDVFPEGQDVLQFNYIWGSDEFYDADVMDRGTPFTPQDCEGEPCVEPLLRMVSRFDWVRQERLAADPDDTWPEGYYNGPEQLDLANLCGNRGLYLGDEVTARTDEQVTAFVTHKYEDQKPSQVGDVIMGFDPYRFDHEDMKEALQWVLGEHFGLSMNP